jgi:hypothetical protein
MEQNFINLPEPILYEHNNDVSFTIITKICAHNLKHLQISVQGKSYNYDEGKALCEKDVEIVFDLQENVVYSIDENGKIVD